jgi:hypothetical protein
MEYGVYEDGDVIDILVQSRRNRRAARRFFRKLLKRQGRAVHYRLLRTWSFGIWDAVTCAC